MSDNESKSPQSPDGFGAKIAVLEAHMEHVRTDLAGLKETSADSRERLIKLEGKVDHLPSKSFIISVVLSGLAIVAATTVFQSNLQSLFGLA